MVPFFESTIGVVSGEVESAIVVLIYVLRRELTALWQVTATGRGNCKEKIDRRWG